ncbi:MAG TPA: type IX secretion system outer membrane channel protein PorV [Bacteroidota bacterium]|nr:type IX secretion system outer membrane channel protein PorV [Bacteroidota bacterium]
MKSRFIAVITLILLALSPALGQVTTSAVPFLLIAPNSRASGMGEAGVALSDDVWATYWNPAGLAFQHGSELSLSHANWLPAFNLPDLWIAHMVYKQEMEELGGVVSAGITYLNLGEFVHTGSTGPEPIGTFKAYEFAVTAGYGTLLSSDLSLGLNARFIHSRLAPFGAAQEQGRGIASGFSFDIGMLYKPRSIIIPFTEVNLGGKLSLGFNLSNIGPKLTYIDKAQADPLPQNLRFGLAYNVLESEFNNLTAIVDFSKLLITRDSSHTDEFYEALVTSWYDKPFKQELKEFVTGIGVEYWYGAPRLVALRFGYFYEDPNAGNRKFLTFGAGLRYDVYGFDFSYISTFEEQHPLGETLRFTLSIVWGGQAL